MGANVFANGMEVSGKASPHNVIASMPDVCLSPPSPPAGPIPIPYPNFAQSSDTTDGSKTVTAGGKEISLKGQSKYKKSTGDEAATKGLGAGVISHNITGPVKHQAGSFDVKVEGSAVVRTLDLTTGNHINGTNGNMAPDGAGVAPPGMADCGTLADQNTKKRAAMEQEKSPTTVTHGTYKPPGGAPTGVWSASSPLAGVNSAGISSGLNRVQVGTQPYMARFKTKKGPMSKRKRQKTRAVTEAEPTKLCDDATKGDKGFKYGSTTSAGGQGAHSGHTESRIIEDIFAGKNGPIPTPGSGATLRLAIDWNEKNEKNGKWESNDGACPNCKRLICAALICGLEIELCQGDPKSPQPQSKDDCPEDLSGNA